MLRRDSSPNPDPTQDRQGHLEGCWGSGSAGRPTRPLGAQAASVSRSCTLTSVTGQLLPPAQHGPGPQW